ncbi:MAG: hypothetical protein ABIQ93_01730 [Saprospiraceae bacterium]
MKVQITPTNTGIIIIDIVAGMNAPPDRSTIVPTELPVQLDKMDFELRNHTYTITDIGNSTLTPTIKTNVSGFNFDEAGQAVQIIGSDGQTVVYSASTDNRLVQIRVNFNTASITVYE